MAPLESLDTVYYSHLIVTIAVSECKTITENFNPMRRAQQRYM